MNRIERDVEREERIMMEAIVDAYGPEEQALGWYYYLDDKIIFPFSARCVHNRHISPLEPGEVVQVTGMAPADECTSEMFVTIGWHGRSFGVPLGQLEPIDVDAGTAEAVGDWHYWMARGFEFG